MIFFMGACHEADKVIIFHSFKQQHVSAAPDP